MLSQLAQKRSQNLVPKVFKSTCHLLPICSLLIAISCAKMDENRALIIRAQNELSKENCQAALDILNEVEGEKNARWYQTKASANTCFSNFREISFFSSGVKNIIANVSQPERLGQSLASFNLSADMTTADDSDYISLINAITTLRMAGNPDTHDFDGRSEIWQEDENINMTLQASYLMVAALGMYMQYFGNSNAEGMKGEGSGSNNCYLNYTDSLALITLGTLGSNATIPCTGSGSGHPDLSPANAGDPLSGDILVRACQGIVLLNSLLDSIAHIPVPSDSGELAVVDDVLEDRQEYCNTFLSGLSLDTQICETTSQDECEQIGTMNPERIEQYFVVSFEFIHRG